MDKQRNKKRAWRDANDYITLLKELNQLMTGMLTAGSRILLIVKSKQCILDYTTQECLITPFTATVDNSGNTLEHNVNIIIL